MTPHLIHHFLTHGAEAHPDRCFIVDGKAKATYGDIASGAERTARILQDAGLARGDRVGLLAHNSIFYVENYYGILKAGGIVVSLNTAADGPTLQHFLADCSARMLIVGPRLEKVVSDAAATLPDLEVIISPRLEKLGVLPAHIRGISSMDNPPKGQISTSERPLIDLDIAAIIYTSGSTGKPRGAVLSHRNIVSNTQSIVEYLELAGTDRVLAILPFYYVYGKSLLNTHALAGGSVVIENRFMFPNTALDTLEQEQCTGLSGVPSTFAILLNRSNLAQRELPALRYVTQAGGPMSPELTRRLAATLRGRKVFVMYGATEASARLSYLAPEDLPKKIGSIGKAIPNTEILILRDDGREAAVDEVGEIVARGSNIMQGYWGDPEETAAVLDKHGYHTGDLGKRDAEGFFWVVGRKKDMIKAGAHRISAKEIEDVILEFTEVHECAVIGIPDEILGEAIKAYVVFRESGEDKCAELADFLKRKLPLFKLPKSIEAISDLPKNESGKIMKQVLRRASGALDEAAPLGQDPTTNRDPETRPQGDR